jgi:hypothetical protein
MQSKYKVRSAAQWATSNRQVELLACASQPQKVDAQDSIGTIKGGILIHLKILVPPKYSGVHRAPFLSKIQ